jgi:hypothetical protein
MKHPVRGEGTATIGFFGPVPVELFGFGVFGAFGLLLGASGSGFIGVGLDIGSGSGSFYRLLP